MLANRPMVQKGKPGDLTLMLTFEGDPVAANYLLDAWPEGLPAHTANPTIPVFVVSAIAAQPQATHGAGCGQVGA